MDMCGLWEDPILWGATPSLEYRGNAGGASLRWHTLTSLWQPTPDGFQVKDMLSYGDNTFNDLGSTVA